jgi:hypothetical protein
MGTVNLVDAKAREDTKAQRHKGTERYWSISARLDICLRHTNRNVIAVPIAPLHFGGSSFSTCTQRGGRDYKTPGRSRWCSRAQLRAMS